MNTASLTKQSVVATLHELLRCLACGKPYARANLAGYRRPAVLETGSAETHCMCAGGPITERPSGTDAAHWEAAADALASHRVADRASRTRTSWRGRWTSVPARRSPIAVRWPCS
jgi:hypothetical protein